MSPKWLSTLVRARQSQEDAARQRLAGATAAGARAHQRVHAEAARVDALQSAESEEDVQAFVAAAIAISSAAATHAAASGDALRADAWIVQRQAELTRAAVARHTVEELQERTRRAAVRAAARAEQRELDEAAARRRAAGEWQP